MKLAKWTKEETLEYIEKYNIQNKTDFKNKTGFSMWSVINHFDKHGIVLDIQRGFEIPTKEELSKFAKIKDAAEYYSISYETARKWFSQYGLHQPRKNSKINYKYEIPTKEKLLTLEKELGSRKAISNHMGVDHTTVTKWFKHYGIKPKKYKKGYSNNKKEIPPKEELLKLYENMTISDISNHYGNVSNPTVRKWLKYHQINIRTHKENQKIFTHPKVKQTNIEKYGTPFMVPSYHSKAENEVKTWLNSLGFNFHSDKKILNGYELDGYDPNINFAFEYCGLYYHSEFIKSDKFSHWKKYDECRKQNIKLFTIFEHEWKERQYQVKNFIKGSLGIYEKKIYARNCTIFTTNKKDDRINKFLNDNHIQGAPNGYEYCVALFYEGDIVGAMTFSKHHRQNVDPNSIVLSRLCWKDSYQVIGGTKRLFSHAPKDRDIISWSDNRWSTFGGVYERLDFELQEEYGPDYFYTDKCGNIKSKQSMKKKNINCRPGQTEKDRALELGFARIWDCGKKKWVFKSG